jgi:hypothetical protein
MAEVKCSICGTRFQSEQSEAMPFCSERCRMIDLHGWLQERYSVPVERDPEQDEPEVDGY